MAVCYERAYKDAELQHSPRKTSWTYRHQVSLTILLSSSQANQIQLSLQS